MKTTNKILIVLSVLIAIGFLTSGAKKRLDCPTCKDFLESLNDMDWWDITSWVCPDCHRTYGKI